MFSTSTVLERGVVAGRVEIPELLRVPVGRVRVGRVRVGRVRVGRVRVGA